MPSEHPAVQVVRDFLEASMTPDPVRAASYMVDEVRIVFTGGRAMTDTAAVTRFNASRYAWVKKALGQFDWMDRGDHVVVYATGSLYGQWLDGREFDSNRYLDRYEIRDGRITRMDVWNDSAEWLLEPALNRHAGNN